MKTTHMIRIALTVIAAVLAFCSAAYALEVQLLEYKSAMLMPQPSPKLYDLCTNTCYSTNANPAVGPRYNLVDALPGYPTAGLLLWQFDLLPYTGRTVIADATFFNYASWGDSYAHIARLYECLSNWDETVVTWQNFLGPTMTNNPSFTDNFSNYFGPPLFVYNVPQGSAASYYWTVPSNVVQRWLDDPASNRGLAIKPEPNLNKNICNRGWWDTPHRPSLTVLMASSNLKPNTPTNRTPVNGVFAQPLAGTILTASPFSDPNGNGHSNSQWQVSADPSFLQTAWDSGIAAAGTSATVAVTLQYQTRYYWRVRYRDNNTMDGPEWSAWSAPTHFDTTLNLLSAVTAKEAKSCMILPGVFADTNYNPNDMVAYNPINPVTNICPAGAVMFWFDLRVFSMYTGMLVNSDGDLAVGIGWSDINFPSTFNAREVLGPWEETNATWNNFIGADWTTWQSQFGASVLDSKVNDRGYFTNHWIIPKELVQAWIDNPSTNNGIALIPQATGNSDLRNRRAIPAPWLTFDLISGGGTPPNTPTNVAPVNGAVNQPLTPTLQSTDYSGPGTHGASQWQISTDSGFVGMTWDSGASVSNLTSITVPAGVLGYSARYYWHVRHISIAGDKSAYSPATSFDTEVRAGHFVKPASANSMIEFPLPISNWNSTVDLSFWPNTGATGGVNAGIIMAQFDLDVFKNMTVVSDALLSVQCTYVDPNFGVISFTPYLLQAPWVETSVTWNSIVGVDNPNFWDRLDTNFAFGSGVAVYNGTTTWTIGQAIIQSWLDGTRTNNGFALVSDTANANCFVMTRRSARGPKLEVDIVPEPVTGLIAALALAAALRRRTG